MHFFIGKVKELVTPKGDLKEAGWKSNIKMPISGAINKIESTKPFPKEMKEYRKFQIKTLKYLKDLEKA